MTGRNKISMCKTKNTKAIQFEVKIFKKTRIVKKILKPHHQHRYAATHEEYQQ